jgi:lipopolysaccharide transport system ATP-binding protein
MDHHLAIRVSELGKQYQRGQLTASYSRYQRLTEVLTERVKRAFQPSSVTTASPSKLFWALSNVGFEVKHGEVVGIIGRNGAGKSTLLKLLSRIILPTTGKIELNGSMGSLLEVGVGFHPELTGRENIYLSGTIMGMRRAEIHRHFDEIVDFAEIAAFIDTPVKRYSSGMYTRLAFSVAAHLEPDILVVDEVLAVGDASFQRKCLNKMERVGQSGRTVLFVSHNMPAITRLCPRTILIDSGQVVLDGSSHEAVTRYLQGGFNSTARRRWDDMTSAPGNAIVRLTEARICDAERQVRDSLDIRRPIRIEMDYEVLQPHVLVPNYHIMNEEGIKVCVLHDLDPTWRKRPRPIGKYTSSAIIPGNLLAEGTHLVGIALSSHDPVEVHCYERDAIAFQVVDSMDGDSARGDYAGPMDGVVRPALEWHTEQHGVA